MIGHRRPKMFSITSRDPEARAIQEGEQDARTLNKPQGERTSLSTCFLHAPRRSLRLLTSALSSHPNSQVKETQNDGGDQVSCLIPLPARPPASACLPTYLRDGMIRPSFRTGREGEREQRQNGLGEEQR